MKFESVGKLQKTIQFGCYKMLKCKYLIRGQSSVKFNNKFLILDFRQFSFCIIKQLLLKTNNHTNNIITFICDVIFCIHNIFFQNVMIVYDKYMIVYDKYMIVHDNYMIVHDKYMIVYDKYRIIPFKS